MSSPLTNTRPTGDIAPAHSARRVAVASAIGTTIEWYDFFIFGTAAATVFGPRFFPQISPVAAIASFMTFGVGFIALGLPIGIVLSNAVFLVSSVLVDPAAFVAWGWRVPFLASVVLIGVGLFIRVGLGESPAFAEVRRRGHTRGAPVLDVLRNSGKTVLLAAGSYTGISALGYIGLVYYVSYATRVLGLSLPVTLAPLLAAAALFGVSVVAFARWSDQIGRRRLMRAGNAALVVWSAVFFPLLDTRSIPLIWVALCVMLVLQGAYIGTQPAVFAELFPPSLRYSGASLSNTLGTILGGAPAPFIAAALYERFGSSNAVGVYITIAALVSWVSVLGLKETREAP